MFQLPSPCSSTAYSFYFLFLPFPALPQCPHNDSCITDYTAEGCHRVGGGSRFLSSVRKFSYIFSVLRTLVLCQTKCLGFGLGETHIRLVGHMGWHSVLHHGKSVQRAYCVKKFCGLHRILTFMSFLAMRGRWP